MQSMPFVGRRAPSSESSPQNTLLLRFSRFILFSAVSMATAIARSKIAPSFRSCAGARFTVILEQDISRPEFLIAAITLFADSRHAASGRPTMVNDLIPFDMSTSTSISRECIPITVLDWHFACIIFLPFFKKHLLCGLWYELCLLCILFR